jgi:hypothetical protein
MLSTAQAGYGVSPYASLTRSDFAPHGTLHHLGLLKSPVWACRVHVLPSQRKYRRSSSCSSEAAS